MIMMLWWLVGLLFLLPSGGEAACTGASPTWTCTPDYTSITNLLVSNNPGTVVDGDTINVSSGTETWGTHFTIQSNKHFSLVGAGIGSTVITMAGDGGFTWVTESGLSRISGFTFKTATDGCSAYDGITSTIKIQGVTHDLRLDHNRFESSSCAMIHVDGDVIGVIDHNQIDNATSLAHPLIIEHDTWGGVGDHGDNSWAQASTIGTVNALFVEDNTFTNSAVTFGIYQTDDWNGARTVYRFNTWTDSVWGSHGTESGGRPRGFRHVELYRNQFNYDLDNIQSIGGLRGGTGMLFDNKLTGTAQQLFALTTFRRDYNVSGVGQYVWGGCGAQVTITGLTRSGSTATVTTSGEHFIHGAGSWVTISGANQSEYNGTFIGTRTSSTTFTYTVTGTPATPATGTITKSSPFDGNTDSTGYPCLDQSGRGAGTYYQNYETNVITPVSAANQAAEPIYCFHNLDDGSPSDCNAVSATDVIVQNRDYYKTNASCSGESCTTGVGRGTSLPTACTTGTGYWKTDEGDWNTSTTETYSDTPGQDGVLYKCTAPNIWTLFYEPYTYPHPLVGGSDTTPPSAPTGLRISTNGENG